MKVPFIIVGIAALAIVVSIVFHFEKSQTSIVPQGISSSLNNWHPPVK